LKELIFLLQDIFKYSNGINQSEIHDNKKP
jgi:hypothetical protein